MPRMMRSILMLVLSFHHPKRRLLTIQIAVFAVVCLAFATIACNADTNVTLIVGGKVAPFEVPPYVTNDGVVMAPVDFVRLLGGAYESKPDGTLLITSATGRIFPESFVHMQDRLMVPLVPTAEELGAMTTWSPSSNTFILKAKLEMARIDNDRVVVATSYPVYYKTQTLNNPLRLLVDIYGADLDSAPVSLPSDNTEVTRIRTGQLDPQTVRIVLDLAHPVKFQVASSLQTNVIQLTLNTAETTTTPLPSTVVQTVAAPILPAAPNIASTSANSSPDGSNLIPLPTLENHTVAMALTSQLTKIINIQYKNVSADDSQIIVTTAGPSNLGEQTYRALLLANPNRLAFDVSNSALSIVSAAANAAASIIPSDNNSLLHDIRWGMTSDSTSPTGRVVIDLLRPVVYTIATENLPDNSGVQYTINIEQDAQPSDGNSIVGKIIIVDPGHGGKDSGAPGENGIVEKNFTLAIGKLLRDALLAAGARPIMTRSDDTFIPLVDRSQLGIDSNADYFISIHCDSSGIQNSRAGNTVYYHSDTPQCRALARSIANRLSQLDISIQSDGTKSDFVRYPGVGFSVLRRSPEPAVLVECGYVDDDEDAKCLADAASQQQLAAAIVAGLRDYIANQ
jgi:N-acetylmuramoyl-L-alanine amidase